MLKIKFVKRVITILLILSLVYANLNMAILGVISYAIDDEQDENTAQVAESKKTMNIEISEFCKNDMLEKETEYLEKITLNLNYEMDFNKIIVSDINSEISDGIEEENEKISTYYKSTKINKSELINAIGENGIVEIEYKELEQENEEIKEEEIEETIVLPSEEENILPDAENDNNEVSSNEEVDDGKVLQEEEKQKGIIIAEDGLVQINKDTEASEEGYITIIYPKNTIAINFGIATNVNKIEELEIMNNKIIEKVESLEEINVLETSKNILVKGEEELLNSSETIKTPIYYTKTVAELGIDKTQISTSVENKVNFTITMDADKVIYDLYKNPQFIIELPSEIETINIENTIILNNQYFAIEEIEQGNLENGNKAILIKLKGEQLEHTKSKEENTQIILETTIVTNELIPSLAREINLHYQNENAKTYDGMGNQANGINTVPINLIANDEIIVETRAVIGEEITISFKEDYSTVNVQPNTYNVAKVNGTVINNIGENIKNAKILGTVTNIGPVSGVENVYYTENENATADINDSNNGWTSEYTQNAKKYLILIENFEQAQIVSFGYYMYMPEVVEEDTIYELKYDVYNNNEVMKTSQITIYQEAERFDYYEDEMIKANVVIENTDAVELGDKIAYKVNIANISNEILENVGVSVELPEGLVDIEKRTKINGKYVNAYLIEKENELIITNINLNKDEVLTLEIEGILEEYTAPSETIKVLVNYMQKQAKVSNKIKVVKLSQIETTITSNKLGQTLEAGETIEYSILLKNNGESHANITLNVSEMPGMYIQKIKGVNTTTGNITSRTAVELSGTMDGIQINPGEVEQIVVQCKAKELNENVTNTMYVDIIADNIENVSTDRLVNNISKCEVVEENNDTNVEQNETGNEEQKDENNIISGTAWLDKNQNGKIDKNEMLINGVQVVLIDTQTSQEVEKTTTDNEGKYFFNNLNKGTYVVAFNYNTTTFTVTDYKNEEVEDTLDSDVVNTTQNNETVAKTEVIDLEKGKTENVNIGLVLNKKFDMSINKGITKVSVNNEQGTNEYSYENTNMAKVEIEGEYLKGSFILVEYEIAVTNVGEVSGYAKMISDKMPEGMKFNSELNTDWYEGDDGNLYCEALANTELQPGETAIVKLVLTKEMTDDKVISPVNTVKLEKTFNEYLIEDKEAENNSAEATIIISLTTGEQESYIWLVLLVIAIIGTGIFGVIKITNKDFDKNSVKERRK